MFSSDGCRKKPQRTAEKAAVWLLLLAILVVAPPTLAQAATANWSVSGLDLLSYYRAISPGSRALGHTWANAFELDGGTSEFLPHTADDPARLGMSLVAFDTSAQIESGLPPSRYQVDSVTVTLTMESGTLATLYYDNTADSRDEILGIVSGDVGRPMEMYGVGFRE